MLIPRCALARKVSISFRSAMHGSGIWVDR